MISVGAVIGGPECKFFDSRLGSFMRYCSANRDRGSQSAGVNLVFHLPGSIFKPDYIGLRTGQFSRKRKLLMIQISVEDEWICSNDDRKVLKYIYDVADEALGLAKTEFERQGIDYNLNEDRQFLDSWKDAAGIAAGWHA